MKRNINLQELSKDHHDGLLLGWKIRQGFKKQIGENRIKDYVEFFFSHGLLPHFKEEEEIVLSYLSDDNVLKRKTIEEHLQIKNLVENLKEGQNLSSDLNEVASVLESHIRFEERVLFPYLEQNLTDGELDELGKHLKTDHSTFNTTYNDEFWKYND